MIPVAITFVDEKMLPFAKEQAENVKQFGMDHEIIILDEIKEYDAKLWIRMADLTMDAIKRHGKIFRLDAEIRFHNFLPKSWIENDNVFFQSSPTISDPWFLAVHTGQIILGKSGLDFCRWYRECMIAMIPPDAKPDGEGHFIVDESATTFALRFSGVEYVQEYIDMDRSLGRSMSANRGTWTDHNTILTHPTMHNWNYKSSGMFLVEGIVTPAVVLNHYQGDIELGSFLVKLMLERNDASIWQKISEEIGDGTYYSGGWYFNPTLGICAPKEYWPQFPKKLDHFRV